MQYVKLQVWTMRMPFVDPRLADGNRVHELRPGKWCAGSSLMCVAS